MSKPYDRLFKTLAEEDPRGLLHLFGSLSLDVEAKIEAVEREVGLPALAVDHVYNVQTHNQHWLAHYEVQTHYKSDVPERLVWYGVALALKFKLNIETVLVLLLERHAQPAVPEEHVIDLGGIKIQAQFRVKRLWEMEAREALDAGRANLLPWVTLMRSSEAELRLAAEEIVKTGDVRIATDFVLLGGLRYDKDDLAAMLGRMRTMLTEEMLKESSTYQWILKDGMEKGMQKGMEQGLQQGLQQGVIQGRSEEARRVLRLILGERFPDLENLPELDAIADPQRLEGLLVEVLTTPDAATARSAIQRAAQAGSQLPPPARANV